MEPGKPSLVVHSSTLTTSENDIIISTNQVLNELAKIELRKRFSIVHTEKYIYLIGGTLNVHRKTMNIVLTSNHFHLLIGYIYDYRVPIRKKPAQ